VIPILERATTETPDTHVDYRSVAAIRLFACLPKEGCWQAAEDEALNLALAVGEMLSVVSAGLDYFSRIQS
jgi:hypothetical protein